MPLAAVPSTRPPAAPADASAGRLLRLLSDPTRLAVLRRLADGPATVTELLTALANPPRSRVGNHLACLVHCRLVTSERTGRHVRYALADPAVLGLIALAGTVAAPHAEHLASCTRIGPDWV